MYYEKSYIKSFNVKKLNKKLTLYKFSLNGKHDSVEEITHYDGKSYKTLTYIFHLYDNDNNHYMSIEYYQLFGERWLSGVFVEERYRRIGLAYMVLSYFIKRYKITKLFVYENNTAAINLYKKLGFYESFYPIQSLHKVLIMEHN